MIPRRFRRWVIFWTAILWIALDLVTYPKDVSLEDGLTEVVGGFFSPTVGAYAAWVMSVLAIVCLVLAGLRLGRKTKSKLLSVVLLAEACVFVVWAIFAGGGFSGWTAGGNDFSYNWVLQTAAVMLGGACVWSWAVGDPERARLSTDGVRRNWMLFKRGRQGLFGMSVLTFFGLVALLAPFLANHDLLSASKPVGEPMSAPSFSYYLIFGTDEQGMSVLAEWIWSARISLLVGLAASAMSTLIGAILGIVAGYFGGWRGETAMRVTDFFLVLPWLPLAMVLAAAWGRSYVMLILIIGVTSWPSTARIVKSEAMRVRTLQFIERSKAIGSTDAHIMARHILPNVFPLIFANTILVVAIAILAETTLSFLGLGDPMNFSWGIMLRNAWLSGGAGLPAWWYILPPGAAIVLVVLGFTFVGRAFERILDPKLRKREESGENRRPSALDHTQTDADAVLEASTSDGNSIGGDR